MPANTDRNTTAKQDEAAANALAREKKTPPGETPVKQHNPNEQGLNPDQRGPAQPSGENG